MARRKKRTKPRGKGRRRAKVATGPFVIGEAPNGCLWFVALTFVAISLFGVVFLVRKPHRLGPDGPWVLFTLGMAVALFSFSWPRRFTTIDPKEGVLRRTWGPFALLRREVPLSKFDKVVYESRTERGTHSSTNLPWTAVIRKLSLVGPNDRVLLDEERLSATSTAPMPESELLDPAALAEGLDLPLERL